jgi:hypothetical protein
MTDIDPQRAVDFIRDNAAALAHAKATRIYVEEFRKTLKARIMKSCGAEAIGAQEREAYASKEYADHLHAIAAAVEEEEKLRWQMIAAQARVEVWRSTEASARMTDRAAR